MPAGATSEPGATPGITKVSALLLAAGVGTRLRPFTDILPKCLMPICGDPLLGIWLAMLDKAGIEDITVNTHHHAELVQDFLRRSPYAGLRVTCESSLLDTAGTLLANEKDFQHGTIMLVHADNLSAFDVKEFVRAHEARPKGAVLTMMTFDTDVPETCGIVETDNNGIVTAFHEKVANPPGTRANAAVYLIDRGFVKELAQEKRKIASFSNDVLPHLMGKIFTWHNAVYHRDIGTPASLRRAQEEWAARKPLATVRVEKSGEKDPWFGLLKAHPDIAGKLDNILHRTGGLG